MNTISASPRIFLTVASRAAGLALALLSPASLLAQANPLTKVDGSWSSNANGSLGSLGTVWNQGMSIQATATATLGSGGNAGKVVAVAVTNPGGGYTAAPVVTITAGSGTGAVVTANLVNGRIASFTVVNAGSGYSGTPTVAISAPAPGGVGSWIRLNTDITSNRVLTLDGNRTYGQLVIGDLSSSQIYTINQGTGGSLTFNNGSLSMGSFINKFQGGSDVINTPIILENQLNVRVTTSRLTLSNTITGNGHMLTSYGNGALSLTGNNSGSNFGLWLWNRGTTSTGAQVELGAANGNAVGGDIIIGSATRGMSGHAVLQLLQGRSNFDQISNTATVSFDSYSGSGRNNYFKLMGGSETVGRILDMGSLAVIENRESESVGTGSRLTISGSQNSFITGFARDNSGNNLQQADANGQQGASSLAITQGGGGLLTMQGGNIIFTGGLTVDASSGVRLIQTTNFRSDVVNNGTVYFDTGTLGATSAWNFTKTYADPDGTGPELAPINRNLIISGSGSIEKTGNAILNLSGRSVTALTDVVNHQIGGKLTVRNGTLNLTGLGSGAGAVIGAVGVPNDGIVLAGDSALTRNLGLFGRITVNGDIVATGRYNNTGSAISVRGAILDQGDQRQGYYQEGRLTVNGNISLNYIDMNVGEASTINKTSGGSTNSTVNLSVTSSSGLAVGMRVVGNGVPADTFIQSINPVTRAIVLTKAASIPGGTNLTFSGQSQGADGIIDGSLGNITIAGRPNVASSIATPGGLYIHNSRASNVANRIPDSAVINMKGGVIALVNDGAAGNNYSEQLGTLNLVAGQSQITNYLAASGATSTLKFAGFNRSYGTTVEFVGITGTGTVANINDATNLLGTTTRNQIRFDSGVGNGFMGGWAWANNEFVKYNTTTGVSVMTAGDYLVTTDINTSPLNSWLTGSNVKLTLGNTLTMGARRSVNSLNFQSVGRTLSIGGQVLSIESGGLLSNGGNNTISSSGNGFLTVGTSAGTLGELNVIVGTTLNTGANTTSVNTLSLRSTIKDFELPLTSAVTMSAGSTTMNVPANTANMLKVGMVVSHPNLPAGTTVTAVNQSLTGATTITLSSAPISGSLSAGSGNNAVVFRGGSVGLTKSGPGTLVLLGDSTSPNTYTGRTIVNNGILSMRHASNLGSVPTGLVANQITLNGGTLQFARDTSSFPIANNPQIPGTKINDYNYLFTDGKRGVTFGDAGGRLEVGSTNPTPDYVVSGTNYIANPVINAVIENPIDAYGVVELAVRANLANPSSPYYNTLTLGTSSSQNQYRGGIKTEGSYEGIMNIHGNNYINGLLVEGGQLNLTGNNNFSSELRFLSGQVRLQGANTYNGGNTFTETISMTGTTVLMENAAAFGTGGIKLNMGNFSTFRLLGNNQTFRSLVGTASSTITNGYSAPQGQPDRPSVVTVDIDVNETFAGSLSNGGSSELQLIKTGSGRLTLNNNTNSFSGKIRIEEGTLDVTSIGYGSVQSALGTGRGRSSFSPGESASYIEIDGGTLSFSPTGQQITNRSFTMGAGPNAATLVANGTNQAARVIFGVDFLANPGTEYEERFSSDPIAFMGSGPRTLTLSGVNSGDNELRLQLSDKSAAEPTSLLKAGPGTWVLTGPNSFSGQVTVQEGVLALAVNNSAGTVSSPTYVDVASSSFTFSGGIRLAAGTEVNFPLYIDTVLPVGLTGNRRYYVINPTATTFQISETLDGPAVILGNPANYAIADVRYIANFQSVASTVGRNDPVTTAPLDDTFTGNLPVGTPVTFGYQRRLVAPVTNAETLGVLPGGIVNNATYYVVESFRSNAGGTAQNYFRVSATPGGTAVEFSSASVGPIYYTAAVPGDTSPGINLIGGRLDLRSVDYATAETITFQGGSLSVPRDTQARWAGNLDIQANSTITISANSELIIDGNLLGTRSLNQLGEGTMRLRGETIVPTLAGTNNNDMDNSRRNHFVQAGTLILDYSVYNTSKLVDVATFVLGGGRRGGTLRLQGGSHEEIIPALNIEAGANKIYRDSGTSTIRLNTVNRAEGSSLYFDLAMIATVDNLNVNNILGGWAIARDATEQAKWVLYGNVTRNFSAAVDTDILEIPLLAPPNNVHYLVDGQQVTFSTTGTLPAGLTAGIPYYVRDAGTRTFKVSVINKGTPVDILDVGTGTHTVTSFQPGRSGPATITFTANPDNFPGSLGNGIATIQIQNQVGTGTINATFTEATGLLLIRTYNNPPAALNNNTARRISEVVRNINNTEARRRVTVAVSGTDNIADTGSYGPAQLSGGTFDNGSQSLGWARNNTNAADGAVVVNGTYANNVFGRDSNTNVVESMSVADTPNEVPESNNASATYTLRFANNVPTTITLEKSASGEYAGQHVLQTGAILVSPTVGANDSIISGPGSLTTENSGNLRNFLIHQYNELGDLVINTALVNRKPIKRIGRLTSGNVRVLSAIDNTDGLLNASVSGSGIANGTTVVEILDKNTVLLSANTTGGEVRNRTTFVLADGSNTIVEKFATQQNTTTQNRINGIYDPDTGRLSTADIYRGMPISGEGIPAGAQVDLIFNETDIRINTNHFFKAQPNGIRSELTMTPSVGLEKLGGGTLILAGDNTYNGVTTFADGVVRAVKLTDAGVVGSLGTATASVDNLVFNGGTLQYVGESASTNRLFRIADYARIDIGHENTRVVFDAATGSIATTGTIGAADRLEKTGSGDLEMRIGASINELKVEQGMLRVQLVDTNASPSGTSTSNFTGNTAMILRMAGGTLEVRGLAEAASSQNFGGALYVDEGASEIRSTSVEGYDTNNLRAGVTTRDNTLTLMGAEETTSVVRAAGGTMRFVENPEAGSGNANIVLNLPVLETQQLLPWAVYQNTAATALFGINDFASVSGATRAVVSADSQFQYDVGGDDLNASLWGSDEPGRNINASEGGRTEVQLTQGVTLTAESKVVSVAAAQTADFLRLQPGMRMSGPGVAPNTFITSVDSASLTFEMNNAALTSQTTGQYLFLLNGTFFGRVGLVDPSQAEDAAVNYLGRNREINTLRYFTADDSEITIDEGSTLTVLGGAILVGGNTRNATKRIAGGGNITGLATASGSGDFIIHNYSALGTLSIAANVVDTVVRLEEGTPPFTTGAGTVTAGYVEMSVAGGANVLVLPRLSPGMEISGPGIAEGTTLVAVNQLQQVIYMSKPAISSASQQVYFFRAKTNFVQSGIGTTVLAGNNSYSGTTFVHGGVLRLDSATAVPGGIASTAPLATSSPIVIKDGVLGLGHGNFTRALGGEDNEIVFKGGGGFAAYGADRIVDFGGLGAGNKLRFGNDGFVTDGSSLILGALDATHKVTLANSIDLGSFSQAVKVIHGLAEVEGEISGSLYGQGRLVKFGQGSLRLASRNYHTGGIEIAQGRLVVANVTDALGTSAGALLMGTSSTNTNRSAAIELAVEGGVIENDIKVGNINSKGAGWVQQGVVDTTASQYGTHASMTVVNGNPAIAYYDAANQDLKFVRSADSRGNTWLPAVTLASRGNVGKFPSLAIINGFPAVSYYDETNGTLCYIRATDASGASWGTSFIADSDPVSAVAVQADGSVIAGGNFLEMDGVARTRLVRLNNAGVLDAGFNVQVDGEVRAIVVEASGRIIFAGDFSSVNGQTRHNIACVDSAGVLQSYNPNPGDSGTVRTLLLKADGNLLVGGAFTSIGGASRNRIALLNSSGTAEAFNPNVGDGEVKALAVETDGSVLIGGSFTSVGGSNRNRMARVNSAGALQALNPNFNNEVRGIVVAADGKIYTGGLFSTVVGTGDSASNTRNRLARLLPDGKVDLTYAMEVDAEVRGLTALSSGKLIVLGIFNSVGNVPRRFLAGLNSDGSLDLTYNPDPDYEVREAVEAGGKLIIGGLFSNVGGGTQHYVGRLLANGTVDAGFARKVNNRGQYTSMVSVRGNAAIAYYDVANTDLCYIRADDINGNFPVAQQRWGTTTKLHTSTQDVGKGASLKVVNIGGDLVSAISGGMLELNGFLNNGVPAVAYFNASTNRVNYVLAYFENGTAVNGRAWYPPVEVSTEAATAQVSLELVNEGPAIAYVNQAGALRYTYAVDVPGQDSSRSGVKHPFRNANGSVQSVNELGLTATPAWSAPRTLDTGAQFPTLVATEPNLIPSLYKRPAVAYVGTGGKVKYVRSQDAGGTNPWAAPMTVVDSGVAASPVNLVLTDGVAAVSYHHAADNNIRFVHISDASGYSMISFEGNATVNGDIELDGMLLMNTEEGQQASLNGSITGTGGFRVVGGGTLAINSSNNSFGSGFSDGNAAVVIRSGNLHLGSSSALGAASDPAALPKISLGDRNGNGFASTVIQVNHTTNASIALNGSYGGMFDSSGVGAFVNIEATINGRAFTQADVDAGVLVLIKNETVFTERNGIYRVTAFTPAAGQTPDLITLRRDESMDELAEFNTRVQAQLVEGPNNGEIYYFLGTVLQINVSPVVWQSLVPVIQVAHATTGASVLADGGTFVSTGAGSFTGVSTVLGGRTFTAADIGVRILVKDETANPGRNGVYAISGYTAATQAAPASMTLVRTADLDAAAEFVARLMVQVTEGPDFGETFFLAAGVTVLNTSPITWQKVLTVDRATAGVTLLADSGRFDPSHNGLFGNTSGPGAFVGIKATIDGRDYTEADAGTLVLVKDEGENPAWNGVYEVVFAALQEPDTMNLVRAAAMDNVGEFGYGTQVRVSNGTHAGEAYFLGSNVSEVNSSVVLWIRDLVEGDLSLKIATAGVEVRNNIDVLFRPGAGNMLLGTTDDLTAGEAYFKGAITLRNNQDGIPELQELQLRSRMDGGYGLQIQGVISEERGTGTNADKLALAKTGSGTVTLKGANTFHGGVSVNEGTLLVMNTSGSATGSGTVTVRAGAVLGGTGFIGGNVVLTGTGTEQSGQATLRMGDPTVSTGPEVLTIQSKLTVGPNAVVEFTLGTGNMTQLAANQLELTPTGKLLVKLADGFAPALGTKYDILNGLGISNMPTLSFVGGGSNNLSDYLMLPGAYVWDTSLLSTTGEIFATGATTPVAIAINGNPASVTLDPGVGSTINLTVNVTGSPDFSYQWQRQTAPDVFVNIGSAVRSSSTTNTYTKTGVTEADEGVYRVRVSNGSGSYSVTSDTATVIVNDPPVIVLQPLPQSVDEDSTATFTASASGPAPITFQWYKGATAINNGGRFTVTQNGNETTLQISNVVPGDAANNYRVVPINLAGAGISSNSVALSVRTKVTITSFPATVQVSTGDPAFLRVQVSGTAPYTYKWELDSGAGYQELAGEVGATLRLPNMTDENNGDKVRVTVNNNVGTPAVAVAVISVVAGVPSILEAPASMIVAEDLVNGASITLSARVGGAQAGRTVVWKRGAAIVKAGPVTIAGITSNISIIESLDEGGALLSTLRIDNISSGLAGEYKVEAKNNNVTKPVISPSGYVYVATNPKINLAVQSSGTKKNKATMTVTVKGPAGKTVPVVTYKWKRILTDAADQSTFEDIPPEDFDITGVNTKTLTINNVDTDDRGIYACEINTNPPLDGSAAVMAGTHYLKVYTEAAELAETIDFPPAMVGSSFYFQIPYNPSEDKVPDVFKATGLPPGLKLNAKTGEITGRPTKAGAYSTITLTAANKVFPAGSVKGPLTLNVQAIPAGAVGVFAGWLPRNEDLNSDIGGRFDLTTTATGTFTGKLTLGASVHAFKGSLDLTFEEGSDEVNPPTATVTIIRTGKPVAPPPVTLTFTCDPANNRMASASITGRFQREVDGQLDFEDVTLPFLAWRNRWSKIEPANPYLNELAVADGKPPVSGYYTMALISPEGSADNLPQGDSFASFTVAANGTLKITGKLADGQTITGAQFVGPLGEVVLFQTLYKTTPRGSLVGHIVIDKVDDAKFADNTITAGAIGTEPTWSCPPNQVANNYLYPAGFGPVALAVTGGAYEDPHRKRINTEDSGRPQTLLLGIAPDGAPDNVAVTFDLDGLNTLADPSLPYPGSLDGEVEPSDDAVDIVAVKDALGNVTGSKVTVPDLKSAVDNPYKTTLTIVGKTGAVSGKVTLSEFDSVFGTGSTQTLTRTTTYYGLIVKTGDGLRGVGFHLLPKRPTQPGQTVVKMPKLSNRVLVAPYTPQQAPVQP